MYAKSDKAKRRDLWNGLKEIVMDVMLGSIRDNVKVAKAMVRDAEKNFDPNPLMKTS